MHARPNIIVAASLLCAATLYAAPYVGSDVGTDADARLAPDLALDLADADPEAPFICLVILETPAVAVAKSELPIPDFVQAYKRQVHDIQADLIEEMEAEEPGAISVIDSNWLLNCMSVEGKPRDIKRLAKKKKVKKLVRGGHIRLIEPDGLVTVYAAMGVPWNVEAVGATRCWDTGYDGAGIVIGHLDTGVDPHHPALQGKFEGHWFDAVNGLSTPYDDNGHGTHTLGVILGGDGDGPEPFDVGVAPGATWVGAKVLDGDGVGTYKQCLDGLEYMADLKGRGVDVRVVCGSWSLDDSGYDILRDVCAVLLKLDILPVFAAGNDGPEPGSADVPACYSSVLAVGAVDEESRVPDFSSRGPAPVDAVANPFLMPDREVHKPDLTAPGVAIISTHPGGTFAKMSGTSMAAPHVVGAAALLLQHTPGLSPAELAGLLLGGAQPTLTSGEAPDDVSGWGVLDAARSLEALGRGAPTVTAKESAGEVGAGIITVRTGDASGALIRCALERGVPGVLEIFDVAGRRVRTLDVTGAGEARPVFWDGADERGRRAVSGVYLARLRAGDEVVARTSFVLVR